MNKNRLPGQPHPHGVEARPTHREHASRFTPGPRNPIPTAIDALLDDQEQRHAWLFEAGEQIRAWREEDRLAGEVWEIDQSTPRERRVGNGSPVNK